MWAGWEFRKGLEENLGEYVRVAVIRPVLGFPSLLVNRHGDLLVTLP